MGFLLWAEKGISGAPRRGIFSISAGSIQTPLPTLPRKHRWGLRRQVGARQRDQKPQAFGQDTGGDTRGRSSKGTCYVTLSEAWHPPPAPRSQGPWALREGEGSAGPAALLWFSQAPMSGLGSPWPCFARGTQGSCRCALTCTGPAAGSGPPPRAT